MNHLDPTLVWLLPALLLSLYAQWQVRSVSSRYNQIPAARGLSADAVARRLLDEHGMSRVRLKQVPGNLTDHYNPTSGELALSESVYGRSTLTALGVAAHEVGHALQDAQEYQPLRWRTDFVPVAEVASSLSWPLLVAGLFFNVGFLVTLGIIFFSSVVVFQLITLPVEFNASRRALALLEEGGYLSPEEIPGARKVLRAAALTYVAATVMSLVQLLRLLARTRSRR